MQPAQLVMEGVSKHFAGVQALREVGLTARAGEVLALMGENGAGKSTLLKIMSGAYAPDAGRIQIDGKPVTIAAPADAHCLGVRVVAQEPEIIPYVSVAENVYTGVLPRRGRLFDRAALRAKVAADIEHSGFAGMIDPGQLGAAFRPRSVSWSRFSGRFRGPYVSSRSTSRPRRFPTTRRTRCSR